MKPPSALAYTASTAAETPPVLTPSDLMSALDATFFFFVSSSVYVLINLRTLMSVVEFYINLIVIEQSVMCFLNNAIIIVIFFILKCK